jgi:hypothetical protein
VRFQSAAHRIYSKELKKLNYREITHPDDLEEHRLNEENLFQMK